MFPRTILSAFVAGLAAIAQAQGTFDPSTNPTITPQTGEAVPAGKPYTLTWTPTTRGAVSIELLGGASQGTLQPVGFAAQNVANSGSLSWTPSNDLAQYAVVGYKIIDVASGKYQFSVPFSVAKGEAPEPTKQAEPTSKPTTAYDSDEEEQDDDEEAAYPTNTPPAYPTHVYPAKDTSSCSSSVPASIAAPHKPTTIISTYVSKPTGASDDSKPSDAAPIAPYPSSDAPIVPIAIPAHNGTTVAPTGAPVPVPSGSYPTSSPALPEFEGAATIRKAGLGLVGAFAGLVLML